MKNLKYIVLILLVALCAACEQLALPSNLFTVESDVQATANAATITVQVQSAATIQTMKVYYSLSSDMSNSTSIGMTPAGESQYTAKLSNLASATTYYLQYEVANAYSSLKGEEIYTFATQGGNTDYPSDLQYVDLGLPSGTKWATCNVGASKPEEYGDYFAWGEVTPKATYSWDNYKWGTENNLTKYNAKDNKTILEPSDDAAIYNWGSNWRMPTDAEMSELRAHTTWQWTSINGVNGLKLTGPNGNSIFLPAAGYIAENKDNINVLGYYYCGEIYGNVLTDAYATGFGDSGYYYDCGARWVGRSVRPVYGVSSNPNPNPDPELPTEMYMIGNFCNWDWSSDGVVQMTAVHSHKGMFWCTRYMNQDTQFKFSPNRAWNGDFAQLENIEGYTISDGNGMVTKAGLYTFVVDMVNNKVSVSPTKIYGIGEAFGSWDEDKYPFTINADGTASITTTAAAELRMYTDIANIEWWQAEYMIYNGKIVYRGTGADQERVSVEAGMTITLNFNAGTGELASPVSATPKYVDLGLPSGIKWADRNVGATKPWEYGDHFAWGETSTKDNYSEETYSHVKVIRANYVIAKYKGSDYSILLAEDDAATAKWGGEWRMPTKEERDELYEYCNWEWTTKNGVEGYKVTSKQNGNSIFLPLAGCIDGDWTNTAYGFYWTSTVNTENTWNAYDINFTSSSVLMNDDVRVYGRSVRPVYGPRAAVMPVVVTSAVTQITENSAVLGGNVTYDGNATVTERGVVYSTSPNPVITNLNNFIRPCGWGTGEFTYNATTLQANTTYYVRAYAKNEKGTAYGAEVSFTTKSIAVPQYVDLGLSVKWATCNVGASKPEDYGDHFAWGETTTKSVYGWSTYNWCNGTSSTLTKYNTSNIYGTVDQKTKLELSDDAARVNWGGNWRMPTYDEFLELREKCTWKWTTQNGVKGYMITNNGNSMFLPAAGYRYESSLINAGSLGYYWSSSLETGIPYYAWYMELNSIMEEEGSHRGNRSAGRSVRPVCP